MSVRESTSIKFRLKPLAELDQVAIMIWSDQLKDNARYYVTGLKKGEWKTVEFRGVEARTREWNARPALRECRTGGRRPATNGRRAAEMDPVPR